MLRTKRLFLLGLIVLTLGIFTAPGIAAQNTWDTFWDGMETALVALATNPTQAYFDTLYAPDFSNRDALFQIYTAEANALSDMQVEYTIFIFQDARAAYQRVVTGIFSQPYAVGTITLPPTNAPVRWVTQGMMDVNDSGQIYADYAVTDGFAKFQDLNALQLAPGQEHGQIGLAPYDANVDQPQENAPEWQTDVVAEMAQLLTVDASGNDAASPDFDPDQIVQFGFAAPRFSPAPEIRLDATVAQDDWLAAYLTVITQPDTTIAVDILAQPLTAPDPLRIPGFVFLHANEDSVIDRVFLNVDLLVITNQLQINPTTLTLAPGE